MRDLLRKPIEPVSYKLPKFGALPKTLDDLRTQLNNWLYAGAMPRGLRMNRSVVIMTNLGSRSAVTPKPEAPQ